MTIWRVEFGASIPGTCISTPLPSRQSEKMTKMTAIPEVIIEMTMIKMTWIPDVITELLAALAAQLEPSA